MLRPTQDYIVVRPVVRKQSEILEIISGEKFTQGVVIAVGPGKRNRKGNLVPLTVKPGEFITYGDLARGYDFYAKYEENGVEYRVLQEADICFIAEPDNPAHGLPDDEIAQLVYDSRVLAIS